MGFIKEIIGTNQGIGGINLFESIQSTQTATELTAGYMSPKDKIKLDGIEDNANNYVHPDSGIVPGFYVRIKVNAQGHVEDGVYLDEDNLTLADYKITDAYIDVEKKTVVLGGVRFRPLVAGDFLDWNAVINRPKDLHGYGIMDAFIDENDNSVVLGGVKLVPLTDESKLDWNKVVNRATTIEEYGIEDAYINLEDNSIVLGSHRIKPLTPSDKVHWGQMINLPNTIAGYGINDARINDGTITIGNEKIKPLTAESDLAADKVVGVLDIKNIPVGAVEKCVVVKDDAERFALTTDDVQKGNTVKVVATNKLYLVVNTANLANASGYVEYNAGNANTVPWAGITDKPDTFYTLPQATNTELGGIKIGSNVDISTDGTLSVPLATKLTAGAVKIGANISVSDTGEISTHAPYTLPYASETELGGVKIGSNINIASDGSIYVPKATALTAGVVSIGEGLNVSNGLLSAVPYKLPPATQFTLGGVKVGKYLSIDSEGRLDARNINDSLVAVEGRIRSVERETANILLKMEAEGMIPDCNSMIAEDFVNPDSIDMLQVKVVSCATGDDVITVESNMQFLIGSYYWITDGVSTESIQIKSVIKDGENHRIVLTKPLEKEYSIENTKIYRTTAWITSDGTVHAAGDAIGIMYKPTITWRGTSEGGVADSNEQLLTSQDNADNFSIKGHITFNDNDLATLS